MRPSYDGCSPVIWMDKVVYPVRIPIQYVKRIIEEGKTYMAQNFQEYHPTDFVLWGSEKNPLVVAQNGKHYEIDFESSMIQYGPAWEARLPQPTFFRSALGETSQMSLLLHRGYNPHPFRTYTIPEEGLIDIDRSRGKEPTTGSLKNLFEKITTLEIEKYHGITKEILEYRVEWLWMQFEDLAQFRGETWERHTPVKIKIELDL